MIFTEIQVHGQNISSTPNSKLLFCPKNGLGTPGPRRNPGKQASMDYKNDCFVLLLMIFYVESLRIYLFSLDFGVPRPDSLSMIPLIRDPLLVSIDKGQEPKFDRHGNTGSILQLQPT